jgi:hypothetical protein
MLRLEAFAAAALGSVSFNGNGIGQRRKRELRSSNDRNRQREMPGWIDCKSPSSIGKAIAVETSRWDQTTISVKVCWS